MFNNMNNYIKNIVEDFNFSAVQTTDSSEVFRKTMFNNWLEKANNDEYFPKLVNALEYFVVNHSDEDSKNCLIYMIEKMYGNRKKYVVKDLDELKSIVKNADPNADLNWLDVSHIDRMDYLFKGTNFNGDISDWDVSNVTSMYGMFWCSKFNGDISRWDVSNVTDMRKMFASSVFNGDISKWDVSHCNIMSEMFKKSKFNQDISNWDVSNVTDMESMFESSKFLQDISNWNVSRVEIFSHMFHRNKKFIAMYEDLLVKKWKLNLNADGKPYTNGMFFEGYY